MRRFRACARACACLSPFTGSDGTSDGSSTEELEWPITDLGGSPAAADACCKCARHITTAVITAVTATAVTATAVTAAAVTAAAVTAAAVSALASVPRRAPRCAPRVAAYAGKRYWHTPVGYCS
jgi:hypothetical protein